MSGLVRKSISATVDQTELVYWRQAAVTPTERTMLLLHGGASNHTRWSEFIAATRLQESWNLIAPDVRGNGESMTRDKVNLATWLSDIGDILAAENAGQTILVGHSLGAHIALHFAVAQAGKLDALVLLDPTLQDQLSGRSLWVQRRIRLVKFLRGAVAVLNALGLRRRKFPLRDLRALDIETRAAIAEADSFAEIAKRYSALGPILSAIPLTNYLGQAIAMVEPLPRLESLDLPVHVLLSGATTVGDFALNQAQVARFVDADLSILHANHWPLTEAPDETRIRIEDWVLRRFPIVGPTP